MAAVQPKLLTISHYPRCCGWFLRSFVSLKVILVFSLAVNLIVFISMTSLLPLKAPSAEYFIKGYWDEPTNGRHPRELQQQCHAQMPLDLRNTTIKGALDKPSQTVDWGVYKTMGGSSFKKVQKFVLLTGFHRRQDGVVGTLLNAHPHAVIAPVPKLVLDLEAKSYYTDSERSQFYNFIGKFAFSRARNAMKKMHTSASDNVEQWRYGHIPGLFAGVNDGHVNVYGVDMGETLTAVWNKDSRKVSLATTALHALVNIPIVVVHEVHHPYDSIALMACDYMFANRSLPHQVALHKAVGRYFSLAQSLASFSKNHTNIKAHFVHGYQLEDEPEKTLTKACAHLGMFCSKTFTTQSASVVAKNISQTRHAFVWSKDMLNSIQKKLQQFSFLRHYLEQGSHDQTRSL